MNGVHVGATKKVTPRAFPVPYSTDGHIVWQKTSSVDVHDHRIAALVITSIWSTPFMWNPRCLKMKFTHKTEMKQNGSIISCNSSVLKPFHFELTNCMLLSIPFQFSPFIFFSNSTFPVQTERSTFEHVRQINFFARNFKNHTTCAVYNYNTAFTMLQTDRLTRKQKRALISSDAVHVDEGAMHTKGKRSQFFRARFHAVRPSGVEQLSFNNCGRGLYARCKTR